MEYPSSVSQHTYKKLGKREHISNPSSGIRERRWDDPLRDYWPTRLIETFSGSERCCLKDTCEVIEEDHLRSNSVFHMYTQREAHPPKHAYTLMHTLNHYSVLHPALEYHCVHLGVIYIHLNLSL